MTREEAQELKPCPFCGGEGGIESHPTLTVRREWIARCQNLDCDIEPATLGVFDRERAIAAWNRRIP